MKKTSMKMLALLLTLIMLVSAIPFASAIECLHESKVPHYVPNGAGFHTTEKCADCPETFGKEACSDNTGDDKCDWCGQTMPPAPCEHVSKEAHYEPNGEGFHTTQWCTSCHQTFGKDACTDVSPADGKCDLCAQDMPCEHTTKEPWYVPNGRGFHTTEKCTSCPETFGKEACTDTSADGKCDWCGQTMPTTPVFHLSLANKRCSLSTKTPRMNYVITTEPEGFTGWSVTNVQYTSSVPSVATVDNQGYLTLKSEGETVITVSLKINGEPYEAFATLTVSDVGTISCSQDGTETGSDSLNMNFTLRGVNAGDVDWTFSVTGSAEAELSNENAYGTTASVNVYTRRGNGVAKVTATAKWGDGQSASDTFVVSFYDRVRVTAYLKSNVKSLRFTDRDVFSKVTGFGTRNVKNYSLYSTITDGCADRVSLYESKNGNYKIGEIYYKNSSKFAGYDDDDYNDYAISSLSSLYFKVKSEGTYELKFDSYEMVGSKGYTTTRGTIDIVTGDGKWDENDDYNYDIVYRTNVGKNVKFSNYDFERYWDENVSSRYEDLEYVKFSVNSKLRGELYNSAKQRAEIKSSDKFYAYGAKKYSGYDLNDLVYAPYGGKTYTEEIPFTAYGDDGESLRGTVTIIVSGESDFTDVNSKDWFYDEVMYVYNKGLMVGTSSTEFSPNVSLTRGMVVTVLYRMAGKPGVEFTGRFNDVFATDWYGDAVEWAANNKIVLGISDTEFAPKTAVTREQLAAILYRYAEYKNMSTSASADLDDYIDAAHVSDYAVDAMSWAVGARIMEGTGNRLNPAGRASRAESAAMFYRFLE